MTEIDEPTKRKVLQILLVDDDIEEYQFFQQACKGLNQPTAITHLTDPTHLMELLDNFHFDVVFLDIMMPKMSGIECLKIIRKHPELNDLPVVMLTGSENKAYREDAEKLGVRSFRVKPNSIAELAEIIRQALPGTFKFAVLFSVLKKVAA